MLPVHELRRPRRCYTFREWKFCRRPAGRGKRDLDERRAAARAASAARGAASGPRCGRQRHGASRRRRGLTASMPRSISAPTTAGCWSRARPARLPRGRRLLAHRAARRRHRQRPAAQRGGDDRTVAALRICRDKIAPAATRPPGRHRGLPRGRQRREFRERVARETGIRLEVIDRETEASSRRPAARRCSIGRPRRAAVRHRRRLDRTRAARARSGCAGAPPQIRAWTSLPSASSRSPSASAAGDVTAKSSRRWSPRSPSCRAVRGRARRGPRGIHMLGTSGTVTTLAGVHLGLARYDRRRVDGLWLRTRT